METSNERTGAPANQDQGEVENPYERIRREEKERHEKAQAEEKRRRERLDRLSRR